MVEYKLNSADNESANNHIADMHSVLDEIAATYTILLDIVEKQETAISSPAINEYRKEFKKSLGYGIKLAQRITDNASTLVDISRQTSKHLQALEDSVATTVPTQIR